MLELMHSTEPECSSIPARSVFDKACPRCAVIWKVVMLRRKRTDLGASLQEQLAANVIAQNIISRNGLVPAEYVDRAYERERRIAATVSAGGSRPRRRSTRENPEEILDTDE